MGMSYASRGLQLARMILVGFLTWAALPAAAQLPPDFLADRQWMSERFETLTAQLATDLAAANPGIPGADVDGAIAHHEVNGVTIVLIDQWRISARHFGLRSRVRDLPTNSSTIYDTASLTKMVAGLTFSVAHDRGDLSLDRSVADHVAAHPNGVVADWHEETFPGTAAARDDEITVRRLLQHNGGLDVHGIGLFPDVSSCNSIRKILLGSSRSSRCDGVRSIRSPGRVYDYSGGGYTVAEAMLEEATGESFASYSTRHVLQPAGMSSSTYAKPTSGMNELARGCSRGSCDNRVQHMNMKAAGGLLARPADYARLLRLIAYGGRNVTQRGSSGDRVFSQRTLRRLYMPATDIRSTRNPCTVSSGAPPGTIQRFTVPRLDQQVAGCTALTSLQMQWPNWQLQTISQPQVCLRGRCSRVLRSDGDSGRMYGLGVSLGDRLGRDGRPRDLRHNGAHYGSNKKHGLSSGFILDREKKLGVVVFVNGHMSWCADSNVDDMDDCADGDRRGARELRPLILQSFLNAFSSELWRAPLLSLSSSRR